MLSLFFLKKRDKERYLGNGMSIRCLIVTAFLKNADVNLKSLARKRWYRDSYYSRELNSHETHGLHVYVCEQMFLQWLNNFGRFLGTCRAPLPE